MLKKWGIVFAVSLLLVGCSKDKIEEEAVADELEEEIIEEIEEEKPVVLPYTAPFTGEGSEVKLTQRPILVTINNHPLARPQSGLEEADIIYEMLAEGNVTRFLALYQSELPAEIGPVRSARDYFINIAKGLDAFYVAHGYSPDAKSMLESRVVDHINGMQYDGILFKRSSERKAPHNSYITGEDVLAGAEKVGASMEIDKIPSLSFYESPDGAKIGTPASSVTIRYGSGTSFENEYIYQENEGTYQRKSNGVVTADKDSETPLKISNVIFMEMSHRVIDSAGRQDVTLTGEGKAYLFQAGIMKEIEWKNIDGVLIPMENGVPAKLVQGQTWISFVPTSPGLSTMVKYLP